jgi:hypothetical protein
MFNDVTNGTTINTSSNGTTTGSFFWKGSAPPGTTDVTIQILADDLSLAERPIIEESKARILSKDPIETQWEIEINALRSGPATFAMIASGPFGSFRSLRTINLVASDPDETLLQPTFVLTPQLHDRLISYDSFTGILLFSSDVISGSSSWERSCLRPYRSGPEWLSSHYYRH